MHELSVTQGMLDIAVEKAKENHAKRVSAINLVIGEMSSIVDDCVQFYFDLLSKDTIAASAKLNFKRIPMQVRCRQCGKEFIPEKAEWTCPGCSQWDAEVIAGQEFYIESIEVD
jgi:hydrogenase nickel incorporation protein HypA/HybF